MTLLADDLLELRKLKNEAEQEGVDKKVADAAFKQHQLKVLDRMEAEKSESFRTGEYLYSVNRRVKGQVTDRKLYVRWALENDPGIVEFLNEWTVFVSDTGGDCAAFEDAFYEAIMGTSMVSYKEDGTLTNGQARAHVDDGAPLPPGLDFRPDPYVGMTKS